MSPILIWGLGAGITIAVVDLVSSEIIRGISDTDLAAAIVLIDLLVNLGLCGLAGYRLGLARGQVRPGLEAAVLAGSIAGLANTGYQLARSGQAVPTSEVVLIVAWNIVLAASAGALGAWGGRTVRPEQPPPDGSPRP
jgi:hypothetical protein